MTHGDLNKVCSDGPAGRDEIISAVAGLTEQVAHLTLQVRRLVALADARRKRSALQRRRKCKKEPQAECKMAPAAATCDVHSVETAEATTVSLSRQLSDRTENAMSGETPLINNLTAQLEAAFPEAHNTNCPEESAIAARVADLHDRLGGFVKSSLQSVRS